MFLASRVEGGCLMPAHVRSSIVRRLCRLLCLASWIGLQLLLLLMEELSLMSLLHHFKCGCRIVEHSSPIAYQLLFLGRWAEHVWFLTASIIIKVRNVAICLVLLNDVAITRPILNMLAHLFGRVEGASWVSCCGFATLLVDLHCVASWHDVWHNLGRHGLLTFAAIKEEVLMAPIAHLLQLGLARAIVDGIDLLLLLLSCWCRIFAIIDGQLLLSWNRHIVWVWCCRLWLRRNRRCLLVLSEHPHQMMLVTRLTFLVNR